MPGFLWFPATFPVSRHGLLASIPGVLSSRERWSGCRERAPLDPFFPALPVPDETAGSKGREGRKREEDCQGNERNHRLGGTNFQDQGDDLFLQVQARENR